MRSRFKNAVIYLLTFVTVFTLMTAPVAASGNADIIDSLPDFGENYIPSSMVNYSIDDKMIATDKNEIYDIVDIVVSKENVIIEETTLSEFVDVFGQLRNGRYVNITDNVVCTFSDPSIASWVFGRIIADEKGSTTITLTYNGLVKNINVSVIDYMDTSIRLSICDIGNDYHANERSSVSSVTRQNAVDTASDMVNMTWTPEKNLYTWFGTNRDPFYAGSTYTGMPYTQYHLQTTKDEFLYALENESDFYTRVSYDKYLVPKYGNDCSGFLSICWGLTDGSGRTRWNTTDFINAVDDGTFTTLAYSELQKGDALYKKSGGRHVIMVYKVELGSKYSGGGRVHVYEQTDIKARSSTYTFTELENSGYTAFSMF